MGDYIEWLRIKIDVLELARMPAIGQGQFGACGAPPIGLLCDRNKKSVGNRVWAKAQNTIPDAS
ncbi:MAG TPA: hypothetical protein VE988_07940 [Gemmataceae bacterium]|nr:hypothetical protein [Gemmataceae bacterium]